MNGSPLSQHQMREAVAKLSLISPETSAEIQRLSEENDTRIAQIQQKTQEALEVLDAQLKQAIRQKKPITELPQRPPRGKLSGDKLELFNARRSKYRKSRDAAVKHNAPLDREITQYEHQKIEAQTQAVEEARALFQGMLDRIQERIGEMLQEATQSLNSPGSADTMIPSSRRERAASAAVSVSAPRQDVSDEMFESLVGNYQADPGQLLRNMLQHEKSLMRLLGELQFSPEQLENLQQGLQHARSVVPALAEAQVRGIGLFELRQPSQPHSGPLLDYEAEDTPSPSSRGSSPRVELLDLEGAESGVQEGQVLAGSSPNWQMLAVPFAMLAIALLNDPAARQGLAQGLSETIKSVSATAIQNTSVGKTSATIFSQTASHALKSTASAVMRK